MTEFLKKSFSSRAATDNYRDGWDAIFGKKKWEQDTSKDRETLPELVDSTDNSHIRDTEFGINECPPAPAPHFYGPQSDGTFTMKSGSGRTTFRVERNQVDGYQQKVYRYQSDDSIYATFSSEPLELASIVTYCSSSRFRAWLDEQLTKG